MKKETKKKHHENTTKSLNKKNTKNKKEQTKTLINKNNYLYIIFVVLLIIVIFLGIKVYQKSKTKQIEEADIVIPILKKDTSYEMNIDLQELLKKEDYSIKISNFRQDIINEEKIKYKITINNDSDANIKVTKDQDENNLIIDQESTRIEGVSLNANKKDFAIYHFSVENKKNKIDKGNSINIRIESY